MALWSSERKNKNFWLSPSDGFASAGGKQKWRNGKQTKDGNNNIQGDDDDDEEEEEDEDEKGEE